MGVVLFALFLFYSEAFKAHIDSLLEAGNYAEALKIVEDSFKQSPNKLDFEKLRVYVLAYQGAVFKASNAYMRLFNATKRHEPELLHWIALGIFNTDNEALARYLVYRLALIHDIEAEKPVVKFIKRLEHEKRPYFIKNLNKIADSNVFPDVIVLAREASTYDEVFTLSPLISRLSITTGINVIDTLLSTSNPYSTAIALWVAGDMLSPPRGIFSRFVNNKNELIALLARIGKLKHTPKPDLSVLAQYAHSRVPEVRKILAFHLGFFGTRAEPILLGLLSDTDEDVMREAAKSLFYMGSERALAPFIQAIDYIDPKRKIWGIDNLAKIADSSVVPYIAKAMNSSPYPAVKIHGIWALALLGGREARGILISLLNSPNRLIKQEAALALGFMGDATGIIQIIRLARSGDKTLRKRALWILCKLADGRGYKYLLDGLLDESLDIRVISALGLWRILNNSDRVKVR